MNQKKAIIILLVLVVTILVGWYAYQKYVLPSKPFASIVNPSMRVGAFYYPWYRSPEHVETDSYGNKWSHWDEGTGAVYNPPSDIPANYYPELGAYSSIDKNVVDQHMAWFKDAGIGVVISSWWGEGDDTDMTLPLILDTAQEYGLKVTMFIEPHSGWSGDQLVKDVRYLLDTYGNHPAFFLTNATSRFSPLPEPKPMFYVWDISSVDEEGVNPSYWQTAMDEIHEFPERPLVLVGGEELIESIDNGHFDGIYGYAFLDMTAQKMRQAARTIPNDAVYAPGVTPGFDASRDEPNASSPLFLDRAKGDTYNDQWKMVLGSGREPDMIVISTFNEWHESTQIEPVAQDVVSESGFEYEDYQPLDSNWYLKLTLAWTKRWHAILGKPIPGEEPLPLVETQEDDIIIPDKTLAFSYGSHDQEHVTIQMPKSHIEAKKTKLVIWAHSGGFIGSGGQAGFEGMEDFFLKRGYALASVGYRECPHVWWPDPVHDIGRGINKIYETLEANNIEIEDVTYTGWSAGPTALALLLYSDEYPDIKAPNRVILIAGSHNPQGLNFRTHETIIECSNPKVNPSGLENPAKLLKFSGKSNVPALLIEGENDELDSFAGTENSNTGYLGQILKAHDIPNQVYWPTDEQWAPYARDNGEQCEHGCPVDLLIAEEPEITKVVDKFLQEYAR